VLASQGQTGDDSNLVSQPVWRFSRTRGASPGIPSLFSQSPSLWLPFPCPSLTFLCLSDVVSFFRGCLQGSPLGRDTREDRSLLRILEVRKEASTRLSDGCATESTLLPYLGVQGLDFPAVFNVQYVITPLSLLTPHAGARHVRIREGDQRQRHRSLRRKGLLRRTPPSARAARPRPWRRAKRDDVPPLAPSDLYVVSFKPKQMLRNLSPAGERGAAVLCPDRETQGMRKPEQGMRKPEQGMRKPEQGMRKPEQGMRKPEQGMRKPEQGMRKPEQGRGTEQGPVLLLRPSSGLIGMSRGFHRAVTWPVVATPFIAADMRKDGSYSPPPSAMSLKLVHSNGTEGHRVVESSRKMVPPGGSSVVQSCTSRPLTHEDGNFIVSSGALATLSGSKTGRSPKDREGRQGGEPRGGHLVGQVSASSLAGECKRLLCWGK